MSHDNTRWSRVSELNFAGGVFRRHRKLPMLQLLGAYGQANFRMIPHCNRAVLIGRKSLESSVQAFVWGPVGAECGI